MNIHLRKFSKLQLVAKNAEWLHTYILLLPQNKKNNGKRD